MNLDSETARFEFQLGDDSDGWSIESAQEDLLQNPFTLEKITPMLYRPFDKRFTYYTTKSGGFLGRPRREVMQHIIGKENLALIFNRQIVGNSISHFLATKNINCHGTFYLGNKGQDYLAPLYLYPTEFPSQKLTNTPEKRIKQFLNTYRSRRISTRRSEITNLINSKMKLFQKMTCKK